MNPKITEYMESQRRAKESRVKIDTAIEEKQKKIDCLSNKIAKLQKRREKIPSAMAWYEVLDYYQKELEQLSGLRFKRFGPYGLRCEMPVVLEDETGHWVYHLTVTPQIIFDNENDITGLRFWYDTGETTENFAKGTIGSINGMNNRTAELPDDAAEIFRLMQEFSGKEAAQ